MLANLKIDSTKAAIYGLTNKLQTVLGYLELGNIEKALPIAKDAVAELQQITIELEKAYPSQGE